MALLEVTDLAIRYEPKAHKPVTVVEGISFKINPGDFVGLIGESGSGKSTLAMAILRLLEKPGRIIGGQILLDGEDITSMSQDDLRPHRWREMSTVFQSSMNALNPVVPIAAQFRDVIEYHTGLRGNKVSQRIDETQALGFIGSVWAILSEFLGWTASARHAQETSISHRLKQLGQGQLRFRTGPLTREHLGRALVTTDRKKVRLNLEFIEQSLNIDGLRGNSNRVHGARRA